MNIRTIIHEQMFHVEHYGAFGTVLSGRYRAFGARDATAPTPRHSPGTRDLTALALEVGWGLTARRGMSNSVVGAATVCRRRCRLPQRRFSMVNPVSNATQVSSELPVRQPEPPVRRPPNTPPTERRITPPPPYERQHASPPPPPQAIATDEVEISSAAKALSEKS